MEVEIITRPEFWVIGLHYRGTNDQELLRALWRQFWPRHTEIGGRIEPSYAYGVIDNFDPVTKAMDYFDLQKDKKLSHAFKEVKARFLVIAFSSDWLYPPAQSKEIVKALKMNGIDVTYCEVSSSCGHDAFLLEFDEQTKLIKHFLAKTYSRRTRDKG